VTTGARKMKPPRIMAKQAIAEIVFAFRVMALSRPGFEQAAQSPQRHPSPQTSQAHFADSCWNNFIVRCLPCAPAPLAWPNLRFSEVYFHFVSISSRWKVWVLM